MGNAERKKRLITPILFATVHLSWEVYGMVRKVSALCYLDLTRVSAVVFHAQDAYTIPDP